jgi:hypothetical protein
MSPRRWFFACCLASLAPAAGQRKSLQRDLLLDGISRYRISLTVRSELKGQEFIPVGAKTYAKPFTRVAEGQLSWPATRRFFPVNAAGNAKIEKTPDEFAARERPIPPRRGEGDQLQTTVSATLNDWSHATPHTLRHRETGAGPLEWLTADGLTAFEEASPRVLSIWPAPAARIPRTPFRREPQGVM